MLPDCEFKKHKFQHNLLNLDISLKNILEFLRLGRHIDEIHMEGILNLGQSFYFMKSRKIS